MALVNDPKSSWQELYQSALVETDQEKLTDLVMAIEDAMFLRAQELSDTDADNDERVAMEQAAVGIWTIKTKKLGWPGAKVAGLS
jgi:hypothetical protein